MNRNLELLRDELKAAFGGLDERQTQLDRAGKSGRWSIQQIAEHLALTYAATAEAMEARIAKGTATRGKPSLAQRVGQFGLIRIGYFPPGRKAPELVTPLHEEAMSGGALIARITEGLQEMDRKTAAAEALFGSKRRAVSHMVLGPLNIDQWRKFHLVHGRHHIQQIRAIRSKHRI